MTKLPKFHMCHLPGGSYGRLKERGHFFAQPSTIAEERRMLFPSWMSSTLSVVVGGRQFSVLWESSSVNSPVPTSVRVRASLAVRWPLNGPHSLPPPPPSAQHAPFALFGRSQYMNDGYDDDDDDATTTFGKRARQTLLQILDFPLNYFRERGFTKTKHQFHSYDTSTWTNLMISSIELT